MYIFETSCVSSDFIFVSCWDVVVVWFGKLLDTLTTLSEM